MNLCIPTLNRYDKLEECVRSALEGTLIPTITIMDNGNKLDIEDMYTRLPEVARDVVYITSFGHNLGVSKSWNYFLKTESYPMIISNDDIIFGKNDIYNFNKAINDYPEYVFFRSQNIPEVNMFSCFSMTKRLFQVVGEFDTNFYPAYFEDNDYHRRMKLNGFNNMIMSVETNMTHSTSSTLAAYSDEERQNHHKTFNKNKEYYISKWGGLPGKEKYLSPFDVPF